MEVVYDRADRDAGDDDQ